MVDLIPTTDHPYNSYLVENKNGTALATAAVRGGGSTFLTSGSVYVSFMYVETVP